MNPDRDLDSAEAPLETSATEERIYFASQWRLMWWKFRDHRLAHVSLYFICVLYVIAAFCEFFAPHAPWKRDIAHSYARPQRIRMFHEGKLCRPFVYPVQQHINPETLVRTYTEDPSRRIPVRFFVKGDPYRMWGLIPMERHLFGGGPGERMYLMGADRLGRDLLSRIVYGSRVSLSIGLVGVALSLALGIVIGGVSGYYGGWIDNLIQRFIEILRSFPTIPLWMALSAAMPATWSQLRVYFCMTVILALIGWTGLARVVRGKILGVREFQIILRHLVPGFASHLIVSVTLAIPGMIAAETSLSFLRLGLRPPTISWGVLLQDAQNLRAVSLYPWLLLPILFVVATVLMFNFLGDGLRDAADPYSH